MRTFSMGERLRLATPGRVPGEADTPVDGLRDSSAGLKENVLLSLEKCMITL